MIKKNKRNLSAAFTVVELMVTIFIITLLTTIVFINYHNVDKNLKLDREAKLMAQEIRRALEMSLSSAELEGVDDIAGYGVSFKEDNNYFEIIYFKINDGEYEKGETVEKIYFQDKDIFISELDSFCNNRYPFTNYSVFFIPPDPKVIFNNEKDCFDIEVTIKHEDLDVKRIISINMVGLIDIEIKDND